MDALEFLNSKPEGNVSAMEFLTGKPAPAKRSFVDNAIEFLTMGHLYGEYGPEKEVSFDASGKMTRAEVPTGDPGFFQDPVTALAMGGMAGVKAVGGIANKAVVAGREALGWLTGGGSEVPALAKAGVKGVVKAVEAPNLAKIAEKRAGVPFAEIPVKMTGDAGIVPVSRAVAEAAPRAADVLPEGTKALPEAAPKVPEKPPTLPVGETPPVVKGETAGVSNSIIPEVKGGATGELPKYAEGSAINLERLNTTEDVRQFINERAKAAEKSIGKRTVTWDETRAQAEALGWDEKAIRKAWNSKGAFTAAEIDATRQTNLNAISGLQNTIRQLPAETTTLPPEVRAQVLDAIGLIKVTSQAASESGRALNIHKRVLANDPEFKATSEFHRILKAIAGKGGQRTDDLINRMREIDFNDPGAVNRFVYNATKTPWEKLSNGAFELWINGLLSNPLTHIVNTTSNALTMAYSYPERLLGAGIEAARAKMTGTTRGIYFGETAQDIFSISKGLTDAVNRFTHTMRHGERVTKLDYPPSALPDKVARLLPTRALTAEDAFFKGFIENQELNRLAYRKAAKEGLEGKAFQERVTNLLTNPDEQMLNDVAKRAQYLTYQKEVGEVGRLIFNARDKVPGLKYFIPFVKTPLNIAKFALERTPLNFARLAARAAKGELQGAQLSEELAKPLMGTMLATATYQLAEQGYITGGQPKQAAERNEKLATGWQPYSVKIGDKYYSYARLEPLGSILGMAADMSQIKNEMNEKENFDAAAAIMGSITTNIANKTFMQGFTNMIQGISDPGRYGSNVVKQLAGSVIPSVSGGIARSIDPDVRDTRSIGDTLQSRIPGASKNLPAKLTVWGEPIKRPGSPVGRMLSPMQISQEKGSPIEKEMLRLDLDIGYPSKKIGNVELTPDEYWGMVKQSGERAKKVLDAAVSSPAWNQLSEYKREQFIKSTVNRFREPVRQQLIIGLMKDGRLKIKDEKELRTIQNQLR